MRLIKTETPVEGGKVGVREVVGVTARKSGQNFTFDFFAYVHM